MAFVDYGNGVTEELNPRDAEWETRNWVAVDQREQFAHYIEGQAHLAALEIDGEADPEPGFDPTPDGTRPDGLYQAPLAAVPCRWGHGR